MQNSVACTIARGGEELLARDAPNGFWVEYWTSSDDSKLQGFEGYAPDGSQVLCIDEVGDYQVLKNIDKLDMTKIGELLETIQAYDHLILKTSSSKLLDNIEKLRLQAIDELTELIQN